MSVSGDIWTMICNPGPPGAVSSSTWGSIVCTISRIKRGTGLQLLRSHSSSLTFLIGQDPGLGFGGLYRSRSCRLEAGPSVYQLATHEQVLIPRCRLLKVQPFHLYKVVVSMSRRALNCCRDVSHTVVKYLCCLLQSNE